LPGVLDSERVLAATAADTPAVRQARKKVVKSFLGEHGREWDNDTKTFRKPNDAEIENQLNGHDLSKPVIVGPPPDCPTPQWQWQRENGNQGSYYTDQRATPTEVGISDHTEAADGTPVPKVQKPYEVDPNAPYLESTAAPVDDKWSVTGKAIPAKGGGTQRVIGERGHAKPL
jgi:hypothetical protein